MLRNRWLQLIVGIVGMVAIANLQYGWTLFVSPIDNQFHWGKAANQLGQRHGLCRSKPIWWIPMGRKLSWRSGGSWLASPGS